MIYFQPNINILEKLETRIESMEKEMERLRTENTGIFTAPMKGVYAFRVFWKAYGSQGKGISAGLFKNGQHEISTYARQDSGFIGSSNGVSLLLEKGDEVCVNLYPDFWLFDNDYHHSTFSGHLLFPMWSKLAQSSVIIQMFYNHNNNL